MLSDVVSDPLLKDAYGQKELDKFKNFMKKDIKVGLEMSIDMASVPSIAIRCGGGSEIADRTGDALGDGYDMEKVNANTLYGKFQTPSIKIGPTTPESYDKVTGKVTFKDPVSLSSIYEGMIVYDEVNKIGYPINLVLDDKTLYIDENKQANLTQMTIRIKDNQVAHIHRQYFTTEQITLVCMATEPVEVIYMYTLVMYLIGRYRMSLFDTKNFRVGTVSYGSMYKIIDDPNIILAKDITLNGQITHSYIEHTGALVGGVGTRVDIDEMTKTPEAYADLPNKQGWGSPEDP